MRVNVLVYKWCWITSPDIYKQYAFGEHSPLPAIFLFITAMHDKIWSMKKPHCQYWITMTILKAML